MCIDYRELNS
jgi:hypothetical protein